MKLDNNFFTLLGLPQRFDVDAKRLKQRLRELQRQYHPDRYARATPHEQRLAAQFSAQLNTAASVLGNPVQRALHLLEQAGVRVDAQNHTETDSGFLLEQMELRDALEDARAQHDVAALQALAGQVAAAYTSAQQDFATTGVGQGEADALAPDAAANLLGLVSKMRFFEKLDQEVAAALTQLR
ncbi:MAG: Fe-S protein assembly co-chaperone HscB [Pseudomonadales bacterium]|nr:Fe-S protein assembly co-chaperone HscB [Gammaproteobacteria bacterium]NNL57167.1 Fe-S protein assembly co-chaperone HscB [Pseudomonadales bacterium]